MQIKEYKKIYTPDNILNENNISDNSIDIDKYLKNYDNKKDELHEKIMEERRERDKLHNNYRIKRENDRKEMENRRHNNRK